MTPTVDYDYVRRIARMAASQLPSWVDRDDLIQEASIAAWKAAQRWDETSGTSLEAFITFRIRGAVRDWIRTTHLTRRKHRPAYTVSLQEHTELDTERADLLLVDDDHLDDLDLRDGVAAALDKLDERTRAFLVEYWMNGRSMRSVGADWDVTEGRVSQVLSQTRCELRRDPEWKELVA